MNKIETKSLLDAIAAVDNRKVTPEVIEVWHGIIGFMSFDLAKEALKLAQTDSSIRWMEPRHIVAWSKEASFRMSRDLPVDVTQPAGVPAPKCKHGKSLPMCVPCCKELNA